ncbi:unnamed protein product [Phaedon cochleariae]|uniref:G-protein coupled receptors family 1 profile domain-containing protein n=1 Tax=Phaedon cochleariae TaxID=80249 RepID=A0A9P0DLM0_PHACE|nr:unnamed protein product [Phaedon cochleariae]
MEGTMAALLNFRNGTNLSINVNDTVDINDSSTKAKFLLYDYLIPLIGSLIIVINLAVVISSGLILKRGQQPRSTYLFLGNVAMSDLVTGIAVVFGQIYPVAKRDHYVCAIQLGMIVSSTLTSVYSVGLIAIDRYLYILHGMQYQKWVYPTRARLLIGFSWLLGGIIGFLPLMGWYGDTDNGKICWFICLAPKKLILLTVLLGVIPIIVVMVLYSMILYRALQRIVRLRSNKSSPSEIRTVTSETNTPHLRVFRGGSTQIESQKRNQGKGIEKYFKTKSSPAVKGFDRCKAIKVVLFTTGSFLITWSPYFITSIIYVSNCELKDTSKTCKTMRIMIASPLAILGFMNSLLNPIIYAWWHKGFRSFVKRRFEVIKLRNKSIFSGSKSASTTNSSMAHNTVSKNESISEP